jgi:hypothetical protein
LEAPDVYYAAAMMLESPLYFGAGDFSRILQVLEKEKSAKFKDIGNKLVLIKTQHLYRKGIQFDINDDSPDNVGIQLFKDRKFTARDRLPLFSDKQYDFSQENRAFNHKHVFKVWSRQVKREAFSEGMVVYAEAEQREMAGKVSEGD